jgi:hypothetical protein
MTVNLKGYITNNVGAGVSGITVEAWKPGEPTYTSSTITDTDGMWSFSDLDDGYYIIRALIGSLRKKIDGRSRLQLAGLQVREYLHMLGQITTDVGNGTAPFVINSTTKVSNLNTDMTDGYHAGTAAGQILVLDASGLVPLANIPNTLTSKDADTVDGCEAADLVPTVISIGSGSQVISETGVGKHWVEVATTECGVPLGSKWAYLRLYFYPTTAGQTVSATQNYRAEPPWISTDQSVLGDTRLVAQGLVPVTNNVVSFCLERTDVDDVSPVTIYYEFHAYITGT